MVERSLGIAVLAILAGLMLVAVVQLWRAAFHLVRHRWRHIRTHSSTRRTAVRRFLLLGGAILALVLPVVAVVTLPQPTNVWVGAPLLLAATLVLPVFLVAAKGARPPTPAETAAMDRTLEEGWRRDAGVTVRVVPAPGDDSQPMPASAMGSLPGLRYVVVPEVAFTVLTDGELDAMLAHERCHIAEYHTARQAVFTPAVGALLAGIMLTMHSRPVVSLGMAGLLIGCLLGMAALRRWLEYRADAYAARRTDATAVVRVLETLAEHREHAAHDSSAWLDRLLLSHPPVTARIRRLEAR